ncbi:MAG: hypothetical protein ACR2G4_09075 [Pyrinomonadaceae bacterium]
MTTANLMLVAYMLVTQAPSAAYSFLGLESPPGFDVLESFGALYVIGYWLEVDNRKYNFRWPYCQGVFLGVARYVIIPYYLFKTRGKYAFLTLLLFLCLSISTSLFGILVAALLVGSRFD